jgi:hypothetical protein
MFQTEFDFVLPRGFVDGEGSLHRNGKMRLATAGDELIPLRDQRVKDNPEYLIILILSRVVTKLGTLQDVSPEVFEHLFVQDMSYLQDIYNRINVAEAPCYEEICPECGKTVKIPINFQQAGRL